MTHIAKRSSIALKHTLFVGPYNSNASLANTLAHDSKIPLPKHGDILNANGYIFYKCPFTQHE